MTRTCKRDRREQERRAGGVGKTVRKRETGCRRFPRESGVHARRCAMPSHALYAHTQTPSHIHTPTLTMQAIGRCHAAYVTLVYVRSHRSSATCNAHYRQRSSLKSMGPPCTCVTYACNASTVSRHAASQASSARRTRRSARHHNNTPRTLSSAYASTQRFSTAHRRWRSPRRGASCAHVSYHCVICARILSRD